MVVVVDVVFISGRDLPSREALHCGFFPGVCENRDAMVRAGGRLGWTPSSLYALDILCNEEETAPALPSPLFYLISDIPKRVHRTARRAVEYGISERRGSKRRGGDALIESPPLHQPSRIYIHPKCQMAMRFSCHLSLSLPRSFACFIQGTQQRKACPSDRWASLTIKDNVGLGLYTS